MSYYHKHIFLCNNVKDKDRKCCSQGCADAMREYLKGKLRELKILGEGKMRVSSSGCLGRCKLGPILVIYPQGLWYTYRSEADLDEILEKSILGNEVVDRLKL